MASDLISRAALLEFAHNHINGTIDCNDIARFPAVDAEPVRHGEWIIQKVDANQTKFYCSKCERTILYGNDYFMKPSEYVANIYPYCHCGAKMDGGKRDAD